MELPDLSSLEGILSSLSEQDMANLTQMASSIMGAKNEKEKSEKKDSANDFFGSPDFETIQKIMSLMEKLNSNSHSRECDLISALKPMLSEKRRKKADEAMSMLRLMSILPLIETL